MGKNWDLNHIGFVVRDMDQVTRYYGRVGIGAIGPGQWLRTPDGGKVKTCPVKIGSLEIEFLQPVEGKGPSSEFLKSRGKGINHLAFTVTDIDREVEELKKSGVKLLFRSDVPDCGKIAYFDARNVGGVILEVMCRPWMVK